MTMFQRKRIKEIEEKLNAINANADERADSLLNKLKNSPHTALIIGGGLAVVSVVVIVAIAL